MRTLAVTLLLAAVGCSKSPAPLDAEPDRSTVARPSEPAKAVGVGELWNAYQEDAAAAAREYGDKPLVRFVVDSVEKGPTGFTVKRSTLDGVTHRLHFPASAAGRLEGKTGQKLEARGRVVSNGNRGLVMSMD